MPNCINIKRFTINASFFIIHEGILLSMIGSRHVKDIVEWLL